MASSFNGFPQPKPDGNSGGSTIKSYQNGLMTLTGATTNVPISSVDLRKSIVRVQPLAANNTTAQVGETQAKVKLTSPTNIEFIVGYTTALPTYYWEVIEFNNVKSIQTGLATFNGTTSPNITISSVDLTKSLVFISYKTANSTDSASECFMQGRLTADTILNLHVVSVSSIYDVEWQVIEFL